MSLIKLNNRAVKDVTEFGSITSLGSLTHISTATASSSASIEFTSGIDSTYKEYHFLFCETYILKQILLNLLLILEMVKVYLMLLKLQHILEQDMMKLELILSIQYDYWGRFSTRHRFAKTCKWSIYR
jgi:hypothetical protein